MDGSAKQATQKLPFFVYGTLLPGQPNAFLWQGMEASLEPARLDNGRLHDMGGYPMLVEAGADSVKGCLVTPTADFYLVVMTRLDLLEGFDPAYPNAMGYRRIVKTVRRENGRSLPAWVYVGQLALVNGRVRIPNGDWATYTLQKNHNHKLPPMRPYK